MLTACGIADPLLSVSTEADPMEIGSSIALSDFEASNDSFDPRRQRSRNRRSSRSKHRHGGIEVGPSTWHQALPVD